MDQYDQYAEQFGFSMEDPMAEHGGGFIKAFIYGAPGSGKTGLGFSAPVPIVIDFERGSKKTARRVLRDLSAVGWEVSPSVRIVTIDMEDGGVTSAKNAMAKLEKVLAFLQTGHHPFQTVVLDPMGEFQRLMTQWVIEAFPVKRAMGNQPGMQDWGKMGSESIRILQAFRALPMHTVFIAHSDMPASEEDEVKPRVQGKMLGPWLEGAVDLVGYMHKVKGEGDTIVRALRTDGNGVIRAKNRGNNLDEVEYHPNLSHLIAKMSQ